MKKVSCRVCIKKISSDPKLGVEHYKKFHPESPESCWHQFSATWDSTVTRLVRSSLEIRDTYERTLKKLNETIQLLENENRMRNVLATKLNGIIMILKSDAQPASKDGVA